eukprot:CAMPEP_0113721058 /NCGR_PEP_ID=MMETSP0038_2-20120614/36880_1 /TAXON_ID=2898 /ORGANISM="Cryptomonas paramecium" /LENGTH=657 /DNA_ID=CAMNT_0000649941 /DNA_START=524 /DNA_END=2494 /DNA_ORIENTATION=+ /assembly_acc=CAM_ASM_000170
MLIVSREEEDYVRVFPVDKVLGQFRRAIGDDIAAELSKELFRLSQLQKLNLEGNRIRDAGAAALSKGLAKLSQLQHLSLGANHIGPIGAAELSKGLAGLSLLQHLDLASNCVGDVGATELSKCLGGLLHLQHLSLARNKIRDAGVSELSKVLEVLLQLQHLSLGENQIGDAGAAELSKGLAGLSLLHHLSLVHNIISDDGAAELSKVLAGLSKLQHLDLGENQIGDAGAAQLSKGLAGLTQLQHLDLFDNIITSNGAVELSKGLAGLSLLQKLDLGVDPQDVQWDQPVPAEVLSQGWIAVISFLKQLGDQTAGRVSDIRVYLAGDSLQGKTSLRLALTDSRGLTGTIAVDDRTIAVDQGTWVTERFTVHFWDLAGQEAYRAAHSFITSGDRSIYLLVYSPSEYSSAQEIFEKCLLPWLNLMYSVSPGARVLLVSTHLETPGPRFTAGAWKQHVIAIADSLMKLVVSCVERLGQICQREIKFLTERREMLEQAQSSQQSADSDDTACCSKRRRIVSSDSTPNGDLRPSHEVFKSELQAIDDRLRIIQDRNSGGPMKIHFLHDHVILLDSVQGDGSSVLQLADTLKTLIPALPFMNDVVPEGWRQLLEKCKSLSSVNKMLLTVPLTELHPQTLGLSEQSVLEGLKFWDALGFVRFYQGA